MIAEIKRRSPSKGEIRPDFDAVACAQAYASAGAAAISVLTDAHYFGGSLELLAQVRAAVSLPLLRKDFILDAYQVDEARVHGADAVLLIVAALAPRALRELREHAEALGLDALVEVHDERELETALAAGADLIGINNRDLRSFEVDLARFRAPGRKASGGVHRSRGKWHLHAPGLGAARGGGRTGLPRGRGTDARARRRGSPAPATEEVVSGSIRIKICGIVHPDDAQAAVDGGADLIGLNFVPGTPRCLDLKNAAAIAERVAGQVERVAVFKDATPEEIQRVLRRIEFERVQFHGEESEEEVEAVDLPVIKAIRGADLEAAETYPGTLLLLDHPTEGGGRGKPWNWADASELISRGIDLILAGGLTPENVGAALGELGDLLPWGVDVATGVESSGNRKDPARIAAFIEAVRKAETSE